MFKYLGHERIFVRFISLYVLGLVLFFVSWTIAYWFLPEGILRGFSPLTSLAGGSSSANSLFSEFLTIFAVNLIGLLGVIVGNYILRVGRFGFGSLVPLAWMVMYAVTLGTNSFSIPLDGPMAPTLAVFGRSGLYEMMAAVLLAAATNSIAANCSESFRSSSQPVPKTERNRFLPKQWVAVGLSILLLAGAALREAYMILNL